MIRKNKFFHLVGMDFESWVLGVKKNGKNLNNDELKELDKGYVLSSLNTCLQILNKHHQKITFFVVFRLEEIYPGIIDTILKNGHEIGWHGYSHSRISNKKILISELEKSKKLLKKYQVKGFQAPCMVFFKDGYKVLKDYGFIYSSSMYGNSAQVHKISGVYEIPISTNKIDYYQDTDSIELPSHMSVRNILKIGLPIGSSYFWGILRNSYYQKVLTNATKREKMLNFFIHNWQLTEQKSGEKINLLKNFLHFPYTINVADVFEALLSSHRFGKYIDYIKGVR